MTERWLPIAGFEGRYDVSDQGRVRSLRLVNGKVNRPRRTPLILKLGGNRSYPIVTLCDGAKHSRPVHSLVARAFIGPRPAGLHVCHLNGKRDDASAANLIYGTPAENESHKALHGTRLFGESVPGAKLTEAQVREILSRYRPWSTENGSVGLAPLFGVEPSTITAIVNDKVWKHIDRSEFPHLHDPRPEPARLPRVIPPTDCVVCGATFTGKGHRTTAKVCSPECGSTRKSEIARRRWAAWRAAEMNRNPQP